MSVKLLIRQTQIRPQQAGEQWEWLILLPKKWNPKTHKQLCQASQLAVRSARARSNGGRPLARTGAACKPTAVCPHTRRREISDSKDKTGAGRTK